MPPSIPEEAHRITIPGYPERIGKVRHTINLDAEKMGMVASDRISTFDNVHPTAIPDKGKILTAMSVFWFGMAERLGIPHHLLSADIDEIIERYPDLAAHRDQIDGRIMLVKKGVVAPIEAIMRGNIAGSGWKDYNNNKGVVCGIQLPPGLLNSQELVPPIFTPSTKEEVGHDRNITFKEACTITDRTIVEAIRDQSTLLFTAARDYAKKKGIILADTKFEWAQTPDGLMLVDEVLTPDSSRFWPLDQFEVGRDQPSFDKQYVRDYVKKELGWTGEPPAPPLSAHVVGVTREKYLQAYSMLTGLPFPSKPAVLYAAGRRAA